MRQYAEAAGRDPMSIGIEGRISIASGDADSWSKAAASWKEVGATHRIALKPIPEQESVFGQHAGYARFAYNWPVGEFKAGLDVGEWLSERTLRPRCNIVKAMIAPWAAALSQNAAKYAVIDFGQAAKAWGAYRKRLKTGVPAGRRVGFPRVQTPEA